MVANNDLCMDSDYIVTDWALSSRGREGVTLQHLAGFCKQGFQQRRNVFMCYLCTMSSFVLVCYLKTTFCSLTLLLLYGVQYPYQCVLYEDMSYNNNKRAFFLFMKVA